MGFLGTLAQIGGFAAAPFTGGWSIPAGAAVGGLLGGKGGDDDDGQPEDPYKAALVKSSANLRTQAGELGDTSAQAMVPALRYLKDLVSQNPADQLNATRGERRRVIDQYDTARRAIAQFSPRGGGMTSVSAQSRFDQAESLADVTSSAQRDAIGQLTSLGVSTAGLALSAEQLASSDLNTVINAVLTREGFDVAKRGQSMEMWGGIGEAAGTIIGDILLGGD